MTDALEITRHDGYARPKATSSIYKAWDAMISRCTRPKHSSYKNYGGRGIRVCDRWRYGDDDKSGFECFFADVGPKPTPKHTLEREDGNRDYEPGNCRWATWKEQGRNRRTNRHVTFRGERMVLSAAIELSDIPESVIHWRIRRGWPDELVFTAPVGTQYQTSKLTKSQVRVLSFLDNMAWATPAEIGCTLSEKPRVTPQGAGRIGGTIGTRLVKMGLAERHFKDWKGRRYAAGYAITPAGRDALYGHGAVK